MCISFNEDLYDERVAEGYTGEWYEDATWYIVYGSITCEEFGRTDNNVARKSSWAEKIEYETANAAGKKPGDGDDGFCVSCQFAAVGDPFNGNTYPNVYYTDPDTGEYIMRGGGKKCEGKTSY